MSKKSKKVIEHIEDNKSLISIRLRTIADEYDAINFTLDSVIREKNLLENEVRFLLKELDLENTEMIRKMIRAKALLMR